MFSHRKTSLISFKLLCLFRFSQSALLGRLHMHEAWQRQARHCLRSAPLRTTIFQIQYRQQQHEDTELKAFDEDSWLIGSTAQHRLKMHNLFIFFPRFVA